MIVGTIALITLLFLGGGVPDYFLVTGLDKAVKEFVVDKEKKKEILAEFKIAKKKTKPIFKSRSGLIKELKSLNANRTALRADFQKYEKALRENATEYQNLTIDTRFDLVKKITDDEWNKIIGYSKDKVNKEKEKLQGKIDDNKIKDPFQKLEKMINEEIANEKKREAVLESLSELKNEFKNLSDKYSERNVVDQPVIMNKDSSKEDLKQIAEELNTIRKGTYKSMLDFRFDLLDQTTEEEWNKIIKEYNKLWN